MIGAPAVGLLVVFGWLTGFNELKSTTIDHWEDWLDYGDDWSLLLRR